MSSQRGLTLHELLFVTVLLALGLAAVLPSVAEIGAAGRAGAGARQMAVAFQAMRWRAVAGNRARGLYFRPSEDGWCWYEVADGNGNGLRTAELRDGTDETLSGPHRLEDRDRLVRLGFPPVEVIPNIPPRRGNITDLEDPVKFGRSDIVSFTPMGASSSGTLYVTDGRNELFGVVLFGPTVRVRVWRFDRRTGRWTL